MKTLKKNNISKGSSINSPVPVNKNCDLPPFFNSDYFGHVVVQTLEELESIPCKLRQDGMIATVVQDDYSDYQLQSSRTGLGICNNNAWIKISKGDIVYDGDNLIIFSSDKERNEYLKVGKAGQIIYSIESDNYFKIDNDNSYTDPFPEKLDTPTEQGTDNNLDYKIPTYVDGKPYWRNSTDFGKVDTIDGIEADENKNIALGVVRKSESNTVTDDFSMQQENGRYVSIGLGGLQVGFGGITATYGTSSISVDNLVPDSAYKFQELLFPKRAVKNEAEKVYPVTYVQGVKADETGRVDISGIPWNYTSSSIRYSGILDKSADATFNAFMGLDSNGYAGKITRSANLLEKTLVGISSDQALRISQLLNGSNGSSGAISVNIISPPLIQNTKQDVEYVVLRGANLLLNTLDSSISIVTEAKTLVATIPNSQIINTSATELIFYYNFSQIPIGTYYFKITSGVKTYFTTLDLKIIEVIENIDINNITWETNYDTSVTPAVTDIAQGSNVFIKTPNTLTLFPTISLKSSPLFTKDDDFYIEMTVKLSHKYLHAYRQPTFSFIGLGDSSKINNFINNSFIYMKYTHNWDASVSYYNNESTKFTKDTEFTMNIIFIKTKGMCRMILDGSNYSMVIPEVGSFSIFFALTGNDYSQYVTANILKAFKIN